MKPFDLKKALAGGPVITRGGRPVEQLTRFNITTTKMPLRGTVDGTLQAWRTDGRYTSSDDDSQYDLFMATMKRTVWVNIYGDSCAGPFHTQEDAELKGDLKSMLGNRAWPVEIEE